MKVKLSRKGYIALGIILFYIIVGIVAPFLPLHDPLYDFAPPEDVYRPEVLSEDNLSFNYTKPLVYKNIFLLNRDEGSFLVYDVEGEKVVKKIKLIEKENLSSVYIIKSMLNSYLLFNSKRYVYVYDLNYGTLKEFYVGECKRLFPLNIPFQAYKGFLVYGNNTLRAYYDFTWNFMRRWSINCTEKPLGISCSYYDIFISFPSKLIKISAYGDLKWEVKGNFTSNPLFCDLYEKKYVYVGGKNRLYRFNASDGSFQIFNLGETPIKLDGLGERVFALFSDGFGKISVYFNNITWVFKEDIIDYDISPSQGGVVLLTPDGIYQLNFAHNGEVKWKYPCRDYKWVMYDCEGYIKDIFAFKENSFIMLSFNGVMIAPLPPSPKYPLGTDYAGRDVLSQLLWSFSTDISIAFVCGLSVSIIGTILGMFAGYFSGILRDTISIFTDMLLLIPGIGIIALFTFVFGISNSYLAVVAASILSLVPLEIRAVKNYTQSIKEKPFIEAAKSYGCSDIRIIFKHILPEVYPVTVVYGTSATALAVLLEVGMAFLGYANYTIVSWGWMITQAYFFGYFNRWWLVIPPIISLSIFVISFHILAQDFHKQNLPEFTALL